MATVIGLFDEFRVARDTAEDLMRRGIHRNDVDMISHASNLTSKPRGHQDDLVGETRTFALPGVGDVFAEGPVAGELDRIMRGEIGGSLVGALVDLDLHESEAGPFAEGVRRGGTLLIVRCSDDLVPAVQRRLQEQGAVDLRMRAAQWRNTGWEQFEPSGTPFSPDELARERTSFQPRLPQIPGTTRPQSGAGGGVWSGVAPHTTDEAAIREHAEAERLGSMHVSSAGTEFRSHVPADPEREQFLAHFAATYRDSQQARYEEYETAYHFGALKAQSEALLGRDWQATVTDLRADWEQSHPQTWDRFRDAVRFGWGIVRGRRYAGPERRKQRRDEHARYRW